METVEVSGENSVVPIGQAPGSLQDQAGQMCYRNSRYISLSMLSQLVVRNKTKKVKR